MATDKHRKKTYRNEKITQNKNVSHLVKTRRHGNHHHTDGRLIDRRNWPGGSSLVLVAKLAAHFRLEILRYWSQSRTSGTNSDLQAPDARTTSRKSEQSDAKFDSQRVKHALDGEQSSKIARNKTGQSIDTPESYNYESMNEISCFCLILAGLLLAIRDDKRRQCEILSFLAYRIGLRNSYTTIHLPGAGVHVGYKMRETAHRDFTTTLRIVFLLRNPFFPDALLSRIT